MFSIFFKRKVPFNTGYLPEDGGHKVYFQEFGNPAGQPVLLFHGGPGSCSKAKHADIFDLRKNRIIMFDQRGCGKSLPLYEVRNNTLQDLVSDAKRLLDLLAIKKTVIYGGSWGSTLALAFAETHPYYIDKLIIAKTFLARQKDIDWISKGTSRFYPDIMSHIIREVVPPKTLRGYYAELVLSENRDDKIKATRLYGSYERMIGQRAPQLSDQIPTEEHMSAFGFYMHYDRHNYGLSENQLLENIGKIENIPALIIHNRLDMVCPVDQSWELHCAMKRSKLVIVPDEGHSSELLEKTAKKEISVFLEGK